MSAEKKRELIELVRRSPQPKRSTIADCLHDNYPLLRIEPTTEEKEKTTGAGFRIPKLERSLDSSSTD